MTQNPHPQYEKIPERYLMCLNDECPLADSCLRRLAARSGSRKDKIISVVNPVSYCAKKCEFYKENKVVTMAYGMVDSFHDVKADDIATLRKKLIRHFGHGSYYVRRNGEHPITPDEQQYIASVFHSYGYEVKYDRTEEETQWL